MDAETLSTVILLGSLFVMILGGIFLFCITMKQFSYGHK